MIYKIDQVNWPEAFPEKPEVAVAAISAHERQVPRREVRGE